MQDVTAGDVLSTQSQTSPEALALLRQPQGSRSELGGQHPRAQVRVMCWVGLACSPAFPQASRSRDTKDTQWGSRSRGGRNRRCCYVKEVLTSAFPEIWTPRTLWTPKSASTSPCVPRTGLAPKWMLRLPRPEPPKAPASQPRTQGLTLHDSNTIRVEVTVARRRQPDSKLSVRTN